MDLYLLAINATLIVIAGLIFKASMRLRQIVKVGK